MTKAQVYTNIRYNENLVKSYQNSINKLYNQMNNLNAEISQINSQINQCRIRINELRSQINELNQLKNKYQKLQSDFAKRQSYRMSKFNQNFSQQFNMRFILSYITGMRTLLSGNEYRNAYNGLTDALDVISRKVRLVLESYDVAAYVYQKHCVEKLSLEEMMKTTRLSETALKMFVKYFDVRDKQDK